MPGPRLTRRPALPAPAALASSWLFGPVDHADDQHAEDDNHSGPGIGSQAPAVGIIRFLGRWKAGWHASAFGMRSRQCALKRIKDKGRQKKCPLFNHAIAATRAPGPFVLRSRISSRAIVRIPRESRRAPGPHCIRAVHVRTLQMCGALPVVLLASSLSKTTVVKQKARHVPGLLLRSCVTAISSPQTSAA